MVKRRNLADLYQKGKLVVFDDDETPADDDVEAAAVYVKKLNSIESEKALRRANAEKASVYAGLRDPKSEVYLATMNEVETMGGREDWIEFLAGNEAAKLFSQIEDEIGAEDEWSKDDYLQGLLDAWEGGVKDQHFIEPTEESERIFGEMQRFNEQVQKRIDGEKDRFAKDFESKTDDALRDLVVRKLGERRADFAWLREYRRAELLFAVRDPDDHSKPYFKNMDALNEIANEVFIRLVQEYQGLSVEVIEGKDLPQTAASSDQSEPPEQPETAPSSGPQAVRV